MAGWIDKWGVSALYDRPLTVKEAARFTVLLRTYRNFATYHLRLCDAVKAGRSAGVVLFDWLAAGDISKADYDTINELLERKVYNPKG